MMTTVAALFAALPLMLGSGTGSELRHPLGISIVGGLLVSQLLTLFTTPVIYIYFDRPERKTRLADARPAPGTGRPMSFSSVFVRRPVATTLLTIGLALAGMTAYFLLPVASLPNVDIPTIFVTASMAGASPETMSTSVATPLERHLGSIADVTEMTSQSSVGSTRIVLQFGLDRNIDGAARDVQAAINAARADLPTSLKSNPIYRKLNPASAPILILALTSDTLSPGQIYDSASTILQQKLSQVNGIGQVQIGGSSLPAVRIDLNPRALFKYGIALEDVRAALSAANANAPKGAIEQGPLKFQVAVNDQARSRRSVPHAGRRLSRRRGGPASGRRRCQRRRRGCAQYRYGERQAGHPRHPVRPARRERDPDGGQCEGRARRSPGRDPAFDQADRRQRPHGHDPRFGARRRDHNDGLDPAGGAGRLPVPAQRPRGPDPEHRRAAVADGDLRAHVFRGFQPRQSLADGAHRGHRLRRRRRHRRA